MSNTTTGTNDDYRRAIAMARALAAGDAAAYNALAPSEPDEYKALAEAALMGMSILAGDNRLKGADKELDRLRIASMQVDSDREMP